MRAKLICAMALAVLASSCGKPSRPISRPSKPTAPPPAAVAPTPAPPVEDPQPVVAPPPEKPKQSPTGFEYGARERAAAYLKDLALDPEKEKRFNAMIDRRDTAGLLEQPGDAFTYLLVRALDDDENIARYCIETTIEASRKLRLIDKDTGDVVLFNFDKFKRAANRSGWVATYLANLRDNPDMLK
ncbi:MAG TPA: hypothetical protein VI643_07740 [Planctomycetota bacterium]|nr:hypothetical protein [Planctomycetota bacterium]